MAFGVVSDRQYRQILQADLVFWYWLYFLA